MIYFVEDDNSIRELVIYTLNNTGLTAEGFDRPSAFWRAMEKKKPNLILLDIMMPEEDGLTVLQRLRANRATADIPVMMLTAKSSEFDKVVGLDMGADDYLPKPFGMMELIARVKALLRRAKQDAHGSREYHVGTLTVNPEKHIVRVDGNDVALTFKEFEMLCLLLKHRDMVITRDQFLNQVWGYNFDGENRTVDVHIRTLRQKLGTAGSYIRTIRGIGYKIGENPDEE